MKMLSETAARQYHAQGYHAPVRVLSTGDATALRARLESFESGAGPLAGKLRHKSHLLFTWLADLIRHEPILDAVEDLIGPDILCWGTSFFIKEPRNTAYVSWHQDSTSWEMDPPDIVTAWIALSDSTVENGALQVIPGSHHQDQFPHRDRFVADNLLSRGQEILVDLDATQAARLVLAAGEMSLHHVRLIHGSPPNPSGTRRIGFAIRYIPAYVRQVAGAHGTATLVRGADRYGHFEPERRPDADCSPAALAYHAAATGAHAQILMRDTTRAMRA